MVIASYIKHHVSVITSINLKTGIMTNKKTFQKEIISSLDDFLKEQEKKFPAEETLTIDLHCHDFNSNVPDELLGRLLNVPETWLKSEDLINTLKSHGCDTFTVTNHNNARSCYELRDRGIDVLTGAEFSCQVPEYKTGIHVLAYGFTPSQEDTLNKLRQDIYKFQEYTLENDIPTIWAHPLYHYSANRTLPIEFFNKMSLLFERFEVINGQRNSWQNMLVKAWVESLTEDQICKISEIYDIPTNRYCRRPYIKSVSGGSDSHMGIFSGLSGTRLHVPELHEKLKIMSRSMLALEAIKRGEMAPYGTYNDQEKMTVTFLDYFCQIAINMKDPGLLRLILHKGTTKEKVLGLIITNAFAELKRHKVTMKFLELFHNCFAGNVPGFTKRFFVPGVYKPVFDKAAEMAEIRTKNPDSIVDTFRESINSIYTQLNRVFFSRLEPKLKKLNKDNQFNSLENNINKIFDSIELPGTLRALTGPGSTRSGRKLNAFNLPEFLDGLSFPFLASAVILSAEFASTKVLYNSRPLLTMFSDAIGKFRHPRRMLWLTDTFDDNNGVAMVLKSMLHEIQKRDLPIDILTCSSTLKSEDHLIVVPPLYEFTFPFYENQPFRMPNILDIHKIFQSGEYDRLICSTEGPMGMASIFLKKAYSVPAYFYVHTDWMTFAKQVLNFGHQNRSRLRRIIRAFYKNFDGLFVLNSDQHKWLTGRDMGFDRSKVFMTAHWADEGFQPKNSRKIDLYGTDEKNPLLLFAGRVSDEKGVFELPHIYKKLKDEIPGIQIAIAGTGPAEKELKKIFPEAIYLGWVDHNTLSDYYSAADMLILPSKFDTFGCVVLEAMCCGLPVIAYNTKGPKDIIEHRKNGFLVKNRTEMVEEIKKYLFNKRNKKSFQRQALSRAAVYNSEKIITQFLDDIELSTPIPVREVKELAS